MPPVPVEPIPGAPLRAEYDVAIVLGAKVLPDGSPSPALTRRVAHAIALARAGTVGNLLMSGGPVAHAIPEARVMRALALDAGIAPDRVHVEERSVNTLTNARFSAPILAAQGWRRVLVVTDSYHMPRALYIFRRHGIAATGSGARPDHPTGEWALAHIREVFAMMKTVYRIEVKREGRL
jgi:uncharacterized SAM-binding protein YcdF (DUF218 family)